MQAAESIVDFDHSLIRVGGTGSQVGGAILYRWVGWDHKWAGSDHTGGWGWTPGGWGGVISGGSVCTGEGWGCVTKYVLGIRM